MQTKSTQDTSQKQLQLETSPKSMEQNSTKSTSSLSDFLVRIYQSLENGEVLKAAEAVYSMKRQGSFVSASPVFSSLKTSKDFSLQTKERTLRACCEKLPTLGFMSASGNLLILPGYYPKIESGYTLSDILEKEVSEKYFLSEKTIQTLLDYNKRQEENNRGFRAEFPKENEIKSALKIGGGYKDDLVSVTEKPRERERESKSGLIQVGTKRGINREGGRVYSPKGNMSSIRSFGDPNVIQL